MTQKGCWYKRKWLSGVRGRICKAFGYFFLC